MDIEKLLERLVEAGTTGQLEHRSFLMGISSIIANLSSKLEVSPEEVGDMLKKAAEKRGLRLDRTIDSAVALASEKMKNKELQQKPKTRVKERKKPTFSDLLKEQEKPPSKVEIEARLGRSLTWKEETELKERENEFFETRFAQTYAQLKKEKGIVKGEELIKRVSENTGMPVSRVMKELAKRGREKDVLLLPAQQSGISAEEKIRFKLEKMFRKRGLPKGKYR